MLLEGRNGIIFGVANKRSIAWACAQALAGAGAGLAFTYQTERLRGNVEELTATLGGEPLLSQCDVQKPEEIEETFRLVGERFGRLDFLIHSLAYAPKEALENEFVQTTREAFQTALDISAYSLAALARAAQPLMADGGSVVSMTYYGAEKVMPGYNVMGVAKAALEASTRYLASDLGRHNIRVNTISAGPINTLAARGVGNLSGMLRHHAEHSPLRRNVEAREVGGAALFLCSDLSSAVTGEVIHVDCGYNIMGI